MTTKRRPKSRLPKPSLNDIAASAMLAAAKRACEENKRFGEPLILWEDAHIKKINLTTRNK